MKPKKPEPYPRDMVQHLSILKRYAAFASHRFACAVHRWAAAELARAK